MLCVDLEFNIPHDRKMHNKEIVEIGIVLCDRMGGVVDRFSSFCKPSFVQVTDSTLDFIHVSRDDIESADNLVGVLGEVDNYFSKYLDRIDFWVSWGDVDYSVMKSGMSRNRLFSKIFSNIDYVDAQSRYDYNQRNSRRTGLIDAIYRCGKEFCGEPHRALSDAEGLCALSPYWR